MNMPSKFCRGCRQRKPYYEFDFALGNKDGLYSRCMICARERNRLHIRSNHLRMLVRTAKRRAKQKQLPFDLTDHVEALIARRDIGCCELTGIPFRDTEEYLNIQGPQWNSPSLDRVSPELGYVYSNVRIVLHAVNMMFGNWGEDRAIEIMHAIMESRR